MQVKRTVSRISGALHAGEAVVIFPEDTSTDGTKMLPFRSALFGSVRETLRQAETLSAIFIQAVSVAYVGSNRMFAVWAREDETPFVPHLVQVVGLRRIEVALTWEKAVPADMDSDRKAITKELEEKIRQSTARGG